MILEYSPCTSSLSPNIITRQVILVESTATKCFLSTNPVFPRFATTTPAGRHQFNPRKPAIRSGSDKGGMPIVVNTLLHATFELRVQRNEALRNVLGCRLKRQGSGPCRRTDHRTDTESFDDR